MGRQGHAEPRANLNESAIGLTTDTGRKLLTRRVRRLRKRIRQGRGLRHRGPEATRRGGGRRRPYLGRDPRIGRQPGRGEPGADGPERRGSGAGDRSGAGAGRDPAIGRRLRRPTGPGRRWGTRSRSTRRRRPTAAGATRTGPCSSARSKPTSGTWSRRRGWPTSSRPSSRRSGGSFRSTCTSGTPIRRWTGIGCRCK